jgi:hypothetical protein
VQRSGSADLLDHTARMIAEGLDAEHCKIMENIPADKRLLVPAGVGWGAGVVGSAGLDIRMPRLRSRLSARGGACRSDEISKNSGRVPGANGERRSFGLILVRNWCGSQLVIDPTAPVLADGASAI